jgi:hypothetical protein
MGGVSVIGFRGRGVLAALMLGGPLLAGCSSTPSMPSFSSMFGSNSAANANASAATNAPPPNFECPEVTVRQGAATLSSSADPAEPTATNLRYQVTIGMTARECKVASGIVSIKVGMQGRVILGPQGSPGPVDVPVRYAVVREGVVPKTVITRLDRVSVNVPPDDSNVLFTHVTEGLDFPMPPGNAIDSYVIYIGFDPLSAQVHERRKPPPKRSPRPPSKRMS